MRNRHLTWLPIVLAVVAVVLVAGTSVGEVRTPVTQPPNPTASGEPDTPGVISTGSPIQTNTIRLAGGTEGSGGIAVNAKIWAALLRIRLLGH
jgi:hypothetical protein